MSEKKHVSLVIIIFSLALFCSYHIYYHFINMASDNLMKEYYEKVEIVEDKPEIVQKISTKETKKEEYFGILTIPKIKLKTGFYDKNSSKNNVSNSVTILKESILPNNSNSIIYLAAHSGIGHLAYFKDLDKLSNNDSISININNHEYNYTITDIYEMVRDGNITLNRNVNEKYLVLTTCSKNKNMQLVILAKMINKM